MRSSRGSSCKPIPHRNEHEKGGANTEEGGGLKDSHAEVSMGIVSSRA